MSSAQIHPPMETCKRRPNLAIGSCSLSRDLEYLVMSLRLRHYGRIHAIPLRHMHIRAVSSTPTPRFTFQVSLTGVILGVGGVSAFVYANYKVTQFKKIYTQWINTARDATTGVWNAAADGLKSGKSKAAEVKAQFLKTLSSQGQPPTPGGKAISARITDFFSSRTKE